MAKRYLWMVALTLVWMLAACATEEPPPVEPQPPTDQPPKITPGSPIAEQSAVISELLAGVPGTNNNLEFIEIYNPGTEAVDLDGWSLWYRMADDQVESLVIAWQARSDVPGLGHYLLTRAGQPPPYGVLGDAEYDLPLFERRGGFQLRDAAGQPVDSLVWGDGPQVYLRSGAPAPVPESGASLERLPGGDAGNGTHSADNRADFVANPSPRPQNSGDLPTPLPGERLTIDLEAAPRVGPGQEWAYTVTIRNLTAAPLSGARASLPLPPGFEVVSLPAGAVRAGEGLAWTLPDLQAGATESATVVLRSPWTYLTALLRGYYVEAPSGTQRAYGPVRPLAVEGGVIPISTARTLVGQTVAVEGVATMYTDGFYAGTTGTKFYLEDDTGGIQAYCPGGKGLVSVAVGDPVRVTGLIELYRDSLEIVPATYPDDVQVLAQGGPEPEPAAVTIEAATGDESLLGRLIQVEGVAARIDEFAYSFEIDLADDEGGLLLVYVSKDAGLSAEGLEVGGRYRVTGISELYDGQWELMPRLQSDMMPVYPAELMLEIDALNSVQPGGTMTYTLTAHNHTAQLLTDIRIVAPAPTGPIAGLEVLDGGAPEGDRLAWSIPRLEFNGGSAVVRYRVTVAPGATGRIVAGAASATAEEWLEPAETDPLITFVGSGVPIWAIQGSGAASPYVGDRATTEGVVIGVFPDLDGFWIQETETDPDPATSAGLFVLSGEPVGGGPGLNLGDRVRARGKVRELSGQTLLDVRPESGGELLLLESGQAVPTAVELDPPLDDAESALYYESLEGMLVQVTAPAVAIGPTSRYGETPLVRTEWGIDRVMRGDPTGLVIVLDDGSDATHQDRTTLPYALDSGDIALDVVGPLAYTYEQFKIEPVSGPAVSARGRDLPSLEPAGSNAFAVATFNVENLFDTYDPHPDDPPIPSTPQYLLDLAKTADAIRRMGAPAIVGLQEVENVAILADLATEAGLTPYGYEPYLIEGTDSRGIDVGYLVRGDLATVDGAASYPAPGGLTSRPPLLITVTLQLADGDTTLYLLNNHFTSMSGGEKPTEPRRVAQAAWNAELVDRIRTANPNAHVIVLGDLNSFYDAPPLDQLRAAGLRHVYEFVEPDLPYSYIYQGESETLDHILVTPGLYDHLVRVEVLHIDADYTLPWPDDATARSVSDHDPLVVTFSLP